MSALVKVMSCCLSCAMSFPKSVLIYWNLNQNTNISIQGKVCTFFINGYLFSFLNILTLEAPMYEWFRFAANNVFLKLIKILLTCKFCVSVFVSMCVSVVGCDGFFCTYIKSRVVLILYHGIVCISMFTCRSVSCLCFFWLVQWVLI